MTTEISVFQHGTQTVEGTHHMKDGKLYTKLLPACMLRVKFRDARVSVHMDSPADIIALGLLIQAEGRRLEKEMVAFKGYTPSVQEAARNPEAFVDGMTETSGVHRGEPPF